MYELNTTNLKIPESYYGFIYKVIFPNGKIYIGQTINRVNVNYFGSGTLAIRRLRKFGKQNLKREILKFVYNLNQLNAWERIFVNKYDSTNFDIGYNLENGGCGTGKQTDAAKCLLSQKLKAWYAKGNSSPNKGKKMSKEQKKKLSKSLKGRISPRKGVMVSEETRKRMSDAKKGKISNRKGKKASKQTILNLRKSHLGKKWSERMRENFNNTIANRDSTFKYKPDKLKQ